MSQTKPLVSIIMNCYNCERFLKEALDSVYAQTYPEWEIIFWDNASSDMSAEIAKSYDHRVKYFKAEVTSPLGKARNFALKKASGKYISFLDCDDMYFPEKLEKQVSMMEASEYVLSYGSAIIINESGKKIRELIVKNTSGYVFGKLLRKYDINMQTVMMRREVMDNEGLEFKTSMKYCPDHNMFMQIASRHELGVINDFLAKYRIVEESLSRKTVDYVAGEIKLTLDLIFRTNPGLKEEYKDEADSAYAKLFFYDTVAALYNNNRVEAKQILKNVLLKRWEYFVLYLLLLLPFPNGFILKILRR